MESVMRFASAAAFAAVLLLSSAASADPRQDLVDGMAKCAAVTDNAARLSCYDALNPTLKAAQSAPVAAPPPVAAAAAPPPVPAAPPPDQRAWYDPSRIFGVSPQNQTTPQQFGGENLAAPPPPAGQPAAPAAIDSITAKVADYSFNPYGRFIVVLDNGQIWRQIQADTEKAHFEKGAENVVEISRGFIGSYNLKIGNSVKLFKVERLK
jgi:hypothetical protein